MNHGAARQFNSVEDALARGMAIAYHASSAANKIALICEDRQLSYGALNGQANQLARFLRAQSTQGIESVALLLKNRIEFPVAYAAALRLGCRITAINWHLTAPEAAFIIADCEASVLIADAELAPLAKAVRAASGGLEICLAAGGSIEGFDDFDGVLVGDTANISDPAPGSVMLYTSGTTGRPKGVVRRRGREAIPRTRRHFLDDGSIVLCTGPLYHAAPMSQNMANPLNQGHTVIIMPRFDPEQTLRLIDQHKVTHSHMVATMFHRLLALPDQVRQRYDVSSLIAIFHGAAPTPVHVKQRMLDWFGPKIHEYYAATETGGTAITPEEWLSKPGSVGRAEPGQEIHILDDTGGTLAAGETGTVYFNAELSGGFDYFKDPQKTETAYQGELYTLGDQGYLDADGYLFLTGRTSELIISGGVNIYPAEIDEVLLLHPAIRDAAAIGVPDEEFGEQVMAIVELDPAIDIEIAHLEDDIIRFCRDRLAHFKCPRSVSFVEELPRSEAGKVYRSRLRDQYSQQPSRRV